MALTMDQLNAAYENMSVYNKPVIDNMSVYGDTVAPQNVTVPSGLQTINIAEAPIIQPVTQSNGLDYFLNQDGEQNQNLTVEEYNKAVADQNAEPTDNFFTNTMGNIRSYADKNKVLSGIMKSYNFIKDPLMGGLGYITQKADKFSSLPYVDQQYVKENMVDSSSGLYKDPYGKNVRSLGLFSDTDGSYGQTQVNERKRYKEGLEKAAKKYGVNIEFDDKGGYSLTGKEGDTEKERKEKIELMTKQAKHISGAYNFYFGGANRFETQKTNFDRMIMDKAKNERIAKQLIAQEAKVEEAKALENAKRIGRRPTAPTFTPQGGGGQQAVSDSGGPTGGYSYDGGGRQGFGYGLKDGGRIRYGKGGIVTL
tara:strand:- start:25 stop:1125 length:1101 start_codon:yes stop_codon:yes gene_type:complete